ncbi:D-alanine--D-alanine ligase [Lutimonas sp.]|jgi:D-alanine-D-alanine ligase|uniref:D-alanine--D-alanine ligase n=1 Tax=Lutimonas sp. TaxID=1872403 RepID=UPI003C77048E
MKKNIAIIMGGYSSEADISIKSGNMVFKHLDKDKFDAYRVLISREKWVHIDENEQEHPINMADFTTTVNGYKIKFDAIFNAIHGHPGEDGTILAYFDLLGIPHSSAPFYQMAVAFNKRDCLSLLKPYGINTARSVYLNKGDEISFSSIVKTVGLPCFVKPNRAGSSFGVSKVYKESEFVPALERAFQEDHEILIEQFLDGIEVSVGVIKWQGDILVLPITEIDSDNDFFDYEAKYLGESREITPARISEIQKEKVTLMARKIYKSMDLKGLSRADFIFVGDEPYFIELNMVPGLSEESILPKQAKEAGISLSALFESTLI